MSPAPPRPSIRSVFAALLPVAACFLQWLCWPVISPLVWFFFYPVVFFSSWLGGRGAGLAATVLSTGLVWWFFLNPVHVLAKPNPVLYLNAGLFMVMGTLFSLFHERLRRATRRAAEAEAAVARRAVDAELREQADLLDRMSRLAKVGGWAFDVATLKGSWSDEVARIHDLDPSVQPDPRSGIEFYLEEDRPLIAEAVRKAVEEACPYDLELRLVSARGVTKWVHTIGSPIVQDGRVVRVQGALQDITDRRRIELALRDSETHHRATLEQRVAERTVELQAANEELESFAYAVSHDLRAPLRAMGGFGQALLDDYGTVLAPEGREYLGHIINASHRMGGLIDGILQLSRATRGELARVPVDLSALAEALLADLAGTEPERAVRVRVQPGILVQGDPRLLEAVMGNLLGNAWKYTSRTAEASIEVDTAREDGKRWIRIRDNGCGFDMAFADKLFKPFQRLHRQDEFPGLGIGLATVQRIVRRHGGELKAVSAPGRGACFQLSLPMPEPAEEP
jgi:hypothetical protein